MLIDADAVGADAMDAVMAEACREETIIVARAWRHWDQGQPKSWATAMTKHAISEGRQGPGKNATDIALAIDAIDLLHERALDGFCVVSNDRDYEPLAARLRKAGRRAVLMTFSQEVFDASRTVWDHCVRLRKEDGAKASSQASPVVQGHAASVDAYRKALAGMKQDHGWVLVTDLGKAVTETALRVKSLLTWLGKQPDFEVEMRRFGGKGREVDCVRLREPDVLAGR